MQRTQSLLWKVAGEDGATARDPAERLELSGGEAPHATRRRALVLIVRRLFAFLNTRVAATHRAEHAASAAAQSACAATTAEERPPHGCRRSRQVRDHSPPAASRRAPRERGCRRTRRMDHPVV